MSGRRESRQQARVRDVCGISGVFAARLKLEHEALVRRIVERQHTRGPDHHAVRTLLGSCSQVVLGHNRLSIIDLSSDANQPFIEEPTGRALVFNGEIYNYLELRDELAELGWHFRTRSDTEVLLAAMREWGEAGLQRLNGMFAFAIFDPAQDCLRLVRDRFGVKPLYYAVHREAILFASTPGEIARHIGAIPDLEYVARGLQYGIYDEAALSPYCGVAALRPGCLAEARIGEDGRLAFQEKQYYQLEERVAPQVEHFASLTVSQSIEQVARTLESAVDLRFRADVPVAIALSGGLDSSSVAASAVAKGHGDVRGFTFGSPKDPVTEGPVVKQLSAKLGLKAEYVWPSVTRRIDAFFETLEAQDAPFCEASQVGQFLVYEQVRRDGYKVLLGGQGGDEAFMGYRKYQIFKLRQLHLKRDYVGLGVFAASLFPAFLREAGRLGVYLRERDRYSLSGGRETGVCFPACEPVALGHDSVKPLWKRQAADVFQTSLPTLLRYEDRNSMSHSVESRLPFMDYRVVELGLALPVGLKLRYGFGKWAVREAMRGRLPDEVRVARVKRHFDVGIGTWMREGFGKRLRAELESRWGSCKEWTRLGETPATLFSDQAIFERPSALAEAVSLLWLADRT